MILILAKSTCTGTYYKPNVIVEYSYTNINVKSQLFSNVQETACSNSISF